MIDKGLDKGLIRTLDDSKRELRGQSKNFFGFRKMFRDYLTKLNVSYFDTCCVASTPAGIAPLQYNDTTNTLEFFDSVTETWLTAPIVTGGMDLNGNQLTIDADADTFLIASTDDQIDLTISGALDFRWTANLFTALSGSSIATNTIIETTAAAGVTIDGVLVKDSTIALADGTVADLSVKIGVDANNGIYGVSDTQLGIAVEGVLVGGADTVGLFTGNIAEQVVGVGVTVDGVLLKDGGVTANSQIASFYPQAAQTDIAAGVGGAIPVTNYLTTINSDAGGDAFTLADGTQIGQMKKILLVVDGGGDGVVTPANLFAGTTITFNDATDYIILQWNGTDWVVLENSGTVVA